MNKDLIKDSLKRLNSSEPAVKVAIIACILSTITAGFSAYASFNANDISNRAYQLEKEAYEVIIPFQKPIMYQSNSKVESHVKNVTIWEKMEIKGELQVKNETIDNITGIYHIPINSKQVTFNITYNLSNAGKGIAINYTEYVFLGYFINNSVEFIGKRTVADNIYPNNPIIMEINLTNKGELAEKIANGTDLGLIIRHEYYDFIHRDRKFNQTSWGKLRINSKNIIMMTTEEKDQLIESYIDIVKDIL